jgi:radical SAM superfamily enzyme YgiQ (UPF0313 family)
MNEERMKKQLLLIFPRSIHINYIAIQGEVSYLTNKRGGSPPLSLATLAALTPPEFEVTIIDENIRSIDFDGSWDLVGITSHLPQLQRAQEIAAEFSKRGVLVVCGGSSVSNGPERWQKIADVLIIGEAERTWPQFLQDFLAGAHKPVYREEEWIDLSISPVPDFRPYSSESLKQYMWGAVQTSRGCPFNCEFCDVVVYMGHKMRHKPIAHVILEIEQLQRLGLGRFIFLADDNFYTGGEYTIELLATLRDWNRRQKRPVSFVTQLSINAAGDDRFLELAAAAGLTTVVVGIETPNKSSLQEMRKFQNIRPDILGDIESFHAHGILVVAGCMVGFDHDGPDIFKIQSEFHKKSGIPNVQVYPLQAFDGTPLKERMIREGRYIYLEKLIKRQAKGTNMLVVNTIVPKQMTVEQFQEGVLWLLQDLYSPDHFVARLGVFFEHFERSAKKEKLEILKPYVDRQTLAMLFRVIKYLVFRADAGERKAFWKMLGLARRSSHPQRFTILFFSLFTLKTSHDTIIKAKG